MMYQVIYIPRVENELAVGEYETRQEAARHLKQINPRLKDAHLNIGVIYSELKQFNKLMLQQLILPYLLVYMVLTSQ